MFNIIIADSDEANRQNFRTFIKTSKKEFNVVRSLENVKDIIKAISETNARLIIADIRFFGPSGIALIKKIHSEFPYIFFIMYGSFNDSDYFEKIAETGAVMYMYKPVKPAELGKNIDKVYSILKGRESEQREQQKLLSSYTHSLPIFEDRFLINLVHGQIDSDIEFLEALTYFKFNLIQPYRVFIVKIDSFRQVSLALDQQEKQMLVFRIMNIVKEYLAKRGNGIAFINHVSSVTAIIGADIESGQLIDELEVLKDEINRALKITVSIGVGREYEKGLDIQISYKQAKSALRYGHVVGDYAVIPIDFVEPLNILTYKYPHKKEELLTYSAVVGDMAKTRQYLNDIFKSLREVGEIPDRLISNIIVDIAISINRYVSEQKNIDQNVLTNIFTLKDALRVTTIDEGYEYLRTSLTQLCKNIESARSNTERRIIAAISEYVDNYYFENISLVNAAKIVGCVPEYLNTIFQKHENKTYFDFVMDKRIAVAKGLLVREGIDMETIAASIGYKDEKYFRGIFLQHEGILPDEYRDLYFKGEI